MHEKILVSRSSTETTKENVAQIEELWLHLKKIYDGESTPTIQFSGETENRKADGTADQKGEYTTEERRSI